MKNSIALFLFLSVCTFSFAQTPCVGASGQVVAAGYSTTNDGYYQQCVGGEITFSYEIIVSGGLPIVAVDWYINGDFQTSQPGLSYTISYDNPQLLEVSANAISSEGCFIPMLLDMPVAFLSIPEPEFDDFSTACINENGTVVDVNNISSSLDPISFYEIGGVALPDGAGFIFEEEFIISGISQEFITDCSDIEYLMLNMEHSYAGDLSIELTCPNGTTIDILQWPSGLGGAYLGEPIDNEGMLTVAGIGYDYFWSTSADLTMQEHDQVGSGGTIPSGFYLPAESLCNLIGCPINGTWLVTIADHLASDNGFLFHGNLVFNVDGEQTNGLESYNYSASTFNQYAWSSDEFSFTNEGIVQANVYPNGNSEGTITYSYTNPAGCTGTAVKQLQLIEMPLGLIMSDDFIFDPNQSNTVSAEVISGVSECTEAPYSTSICYSDDEEQYITYCRQDYFTCDGTFVLELNGALESGFDFITVWEGANTANAPLYNGSLGLASPLQLATLLDCFTILIDSDLSVSCENGTLDPIEISLYVDPIGFPDYNWTPSNLVADDTSLSTEVLPIAEDTWFTLTVSIPSYYGCSVSDSVMVYIPSNAVMLAVFHDANENGIFDSGENPIPYFPIDADILGTVYTSANGNILTSLDEATTFEINVDASNWELTTPSFIEVNEEDWEGYVINYYFGVKPTANTNVDIEVALSGITPLCNSSSYAHASIFNNGNYYPGGQIVVTLDPLYTFVSSYPEPTSVTSNVLTYEVPSLLFNEQYAVVMSLQNPDETSFSEVTNHLIEGYYIISEGVMSTVQDADSLQTTIMCSYDPNNKLTHTGTGEENFIHPNTDLEYTINFQNIGNAPAATVTLTDEISELLDVTSLQPIAWSHDFVLSINDNIATFLFEDIQLLGVEQNEAESHGFVRFKIKQQPNLAPATVIENIAEIVFDNNEPIITNAAVNTIITPIGIAELEQHQLNVFPNPVADMLTWSNTDYRLTKVVNALGMTVKTRTSSNQTAYDMSALPAGIYLLQFENNKGEIARREVVKR